MPRIDPDLIGGANVAAFLDMIAKSEGTAGHGDDGYNVMVGSTPRRPSLIQSYECHPRLVVDLGRGLKSSAAGRYQFLSRTWDALYRSESLTGFDPISQDKAAVALIRGAGALDDVKAGHFSRAVSKVRKIWASLPGAGYGQRENAIEKLQAAYVEAGGRVA